jgi:hypothetical protein
MDRKQLTRAMFGDDPIVTNDQLLKLKVDAGLENMPTQETYHYRYGASGKGPRAYDWMDKPHRLVFDLCATIETMQVELDLLKNA